MYPWKWSQAEWVLSTIGRSKLSLMTDYCLRFRGASTVPDPYYGGTEGVRACAKFVRLTLTFTYTLDIARRGLTNKLPCNPWR